MKYGYILEYASAVEQADNITALQEAMGQEGKIYEEAQVNEETRPKWKALLEKLNKGDELYVVKFANAVRGLREISMLFELCMVEKIRIVSIQDKVDTAIECYARAFGIIGTLPLDISAHRLRESGKRMRKRTLSPIQAENKKKRNDLVEELYQKGSKIADIMDATRIRSNSTVYRILEERGYTDLRRNPGEKGGKA